MHTQLATTVHHHNSGELSDSGLNIMHTHTFVSHRPWGEWEICCAVCSISSHHSCARSAVLCRHDEHLYIDVYFPIRAQGFSAVQPPTPHSCIFIACLCVWVICLRPSDAREQNPASKPFVCAGWLAFAGDGELHHQLRSAIFFPHTHTQSVCNWCCFIPFFCYRDVDPQSDWWNSIRRKMCACVCAGFVRMRCW